MFILEKRFFLRFVFSLHFFSNFFLNPFILLMKVVPSLIMASGSQLKVKTIKYIILTGLAGCFIINIP